MTRNPLDMSLRDQGEALREGRLDLAALWDAMAARIAAREPDLRAIVHGPGEAPQPAEGEAPLLAGLPIGIKDIIDVAGQPTTCGSHAHDAAPAPRDAACVAALRAAGMVPAAKLATYEYALTGPAWDQPSPPARNPWNKEHITGGSSSGSAAAVAGGLFRAALGTDTGGSIRAPAAYCGIVGLKPTHGLVPVEGCFPLSESLDCIGPLAACVEDAALVLDALAPGARPAAGRIGEGIAGLTIGYARDWFAQDPAADPALIEAMDDAAAALSRLGARIELIELPDYALAEAAGTVILQAEALAVHGKALAARFERYGVDARRNLITGAVLTDDDLAAARAHGAMWRGAVDAALAGRAALLAPTTLGPAPRFSDFEDGAVWTAMRTLPFNMTGHPAISVPCGFSGGLPLGMQLVGAHGDEAGICRIAHAFEQATDHSARPAIGAEPVSLD